MPRKDFSQRKEVEISHSIQFKLIKSSWDIQTAEEFRKKLGLRDKSMFGNLGFQSWKRSNFASNSRFQSLKLKEIKEPKNIAGHSKVEAL